MEVKNVIGDNSPEVFEKLQGGTLINVQIEEVVTEDEVVDFKNYLFRRNVMCVEFAN